MMRSILGELKSEFEPVTKLTKEILNDKIEKVIMSYRIVDSKCAITTTGYGWIANMEHIT